MSNRVSVDQWEQARSDDMNAEVGSRFVRPLVRTFLAVLGLAMLAGPMPAQADGFPFGRELLLDAAPMRGSKKVPLLDIGESGTAEIELWCNSVKAQLVVAGDTITIITGEPSARQCPPDRARADEALLAALTDVTGWRMERSALVLTGSRTLRFRLPTN
jgi:heat shock protein HslJ